MNKFSVDYTDLQSKLDRKKAYRLADVQGRIRKVAFDVVRFVDSDKIDDLWRIHREGDDEYIVAMYDDEDAKVVQKKASIPWSAVADKDCQNVHIFFYETPITRIALAPLGIPAEDAHMVCKSIPEKLASDHDFLGKFVNNLNEYERSVLEEALPEFKRQ